MKRLVFFTLGLLAAVCISSCSKDDAEAEEAFKVIDEEICGVWRFEEELTPFNSEHTVEVLYAAPETRSEEPSVNMYYQIIDIETDGHFVWKKRYYYPHAWLYDTESWGEKEVLYECSGKIEISGEKLSFVYDKWFMGKPGIVFTYELSADGKQLTLHGMSDGFQPSAYQMQFYKEEHLHY